MVQPVLPGRSRVRFVSWHHFWHKDGPLVIVDAHGELIDQLRQGLHGLFWTFWPVLFFLCTRAGNSFFFVNCRLKFEPSWASLLKKPCAEKSQNFHHRPCSRTTVAPCPRLPPLSLDPPLWCSTWPRPCPDQDRRPINRAPGPAAFETATSSWTGVTPRIVCFSSSAAR